MHCINTEERVPATWTVNASRKGNQEEESVLRNPWNAVEPRGIGDNRKEDVGAVSTSETSGKLFLLAVRFSG